MATTKPVKFIPKKRAKSSKYEPILQELLQKGFVTYPIAKKDPPRRAAHRLYLSLHALISRRTGKAPKLSVRIGEGNILGVSLKKGGSK